MGNDITWWKDRDKWMPGAPDDPPPHRPPEDLPELPQEDIGEIADDDSDEFDDVTPPHRGPDS